MKMYQRRPRTTLERLLPSLESNVSGFCGDSKGFAVHNSPQELQNSSCFEERKMQVYKRRQRTSERLLPSLESNGFGGDSKGSDVLKCPQELKNLSYFGGNNIEVPLSVKRRVYERIMVGVLPTPQEHPIQSSPSERPMKACRSEITMCNHMNEAPVEVISKESKYSGSSRPGFSARQRVRKRKRKTEDESSGSEVTTPKHVHVRGRHRIGRNRSNKGRGMLDSGKFEDYFMHLWDDFSEDKVNSFAYFGPSWFCLYSEARSRSKVLGWIKKKGIHSKKYILVPIVIWGHWSLLIFCHLGESLQSESNAPCALLLDSLQAIGPKRLEPLIRRLLLDIYNAEDWQANKEEINKIPLMIPKVPQQVKGDECGYYVLYFIYLFIQNAPQVFNAGGYPYSMKKDWFTVEDIESFYKRLDAFPSDSIGHASDDSSDSSVELIVG